LLPDAQVTATGRLLTPHKLQALDAHLFACGPSMRHFKVAKSDLAFPGVIVAEYLTFMETLARADIQLFIQ
jgi:peroxiredoxin family protein